jgi:hypothetical protein
MKKTLELYRTELDPESSDEGRLDPLGLATLSERLAGRLLPGLLERQKRPGFLGICCVGLSIMNEVKAKISPSDCPVDFWEAYEWTVVTGIIARHGDNIQDLPANNKARTAKKNETALSPASYLKTPSVFGFHGVYKFLMKELQLENREYLGENGFGLLNAWAKDRDLPGFIANQAGSGKSERKKLIDIVISSMAKGCLSESWRSGFWEFMAENFHHLKPGREEQKLITDLLRSNDSRREVIDFYSSNFTPEDSKALLRDEKIFYQRAKDHVSKNTKDRIDLVIKYETFARLITDAFNQTLEALTAERYGLSADQLSALKANKDAFALIPSAIHDFRAALGNIDDNADLAEQIDRFKAFEHSLNALDFTNKLIRHHCENQRRKPPNGKAPWLRQTDSHKWLMAPGYYREETADRTSQFVHPYRLNTIALFAKDLNLHGAK